VCAALSVLSTAPIVAQQASLGVTGSQSAAPFRHQIGRRVTYVCPAITPSNDIAVWGTKVYTFDSSVCLAAIHAGKLRAEQAGAVTFTMGPGVASFTKAEQNGVRSDGYGPYDSSFTFDDSTEPGRIDGMTTMRFPRGFADSVAVMCPPLGTFPQPLWGTDIYTDESSICAAAAHVGLISLDAGGGPITVTPRETKNRSRARCATASRRSATAMRRMSCSEKCRRPCRSSFRLRQAG
jgi:hypothetical protein